MASSDESAAPRELEVITADMETRLRGTILKIIRPALDQIADVGARLDELNRHVERHEEVIIEAEKQKEVIAQQAEFTKLVSDRADELDVNLRKIERNTSSGIAELRTGHGDLEKRFEEQQGELRRQGRDISRLWEEATRLQEQHEDSSRKVWEGIGAGNKKTERGREECMELVRELQVQREELLEELFGDGKGLTKMARDLTALTKFVQPLPDLERQQNALMEQATRLEKSQDEVKVYCESNQKDMEHFYQAVEQKVLVMKEEFKQEGNKLVAHHASLMKDIRRDYAEEIEANKSIRDEITRFQRNTDDFCHEVQQSVKSEARRIDAIHREIVQDLEEIQKRRRKDRAAIEMELKDTKRQMIVGREMSTEVGTNVEFLSRIIGLVLEGERLSSAMLVQDFSDRRGETWLAPPSELGRRAQLPLVAEGLEQQRHNKIWNAAQQQARDLLPIDWRKGLVKSEYLPGSVAYQGAVYERKDMLLLHHKLLQKAHTAFLRGPPTEGQPPNAPAGALAAAAAPPGGVLGQPGANGMAASAGQVPSKRLNSKLEGDDPEDAFSAPLASARSRGGGSRQRPGSQGQPEAMGSRGTMSGPLGETSPQPTAPGSQDQPLRLPAIGRAGGGSSGGSSAQDDGGARSPPLGFKALSAR